MWRLIPTPSSRCVALTVRASRNSAIGTHATTSSASSSACTPALSIPWQFQSMHSTQTMASIARTSAATVRRTMATTAASATNNNSSLILSSFPTAHSSISSCPSPHFQRAAQLHQWTIVQSDATPTKTTPAQPTPADPSKPPASTSAAPQAKPKRRTIKTIRYDMLQYVATHFPQVREWMTLVKIELSFVVTMSSLFGYVMAGSDAWSLPHMLANFAGTALCAASAAIGNQWLETPYDAQMKRTSQRPLVTGAINRKTALAVAFVLPIPGAALLHYAAAGDLVAPLLGVGTILAYTMMYTPLKRLHRWNTELGAIVGSVPVLIGWSCAISHWSHHMVCVHQMHLPFTTLQSLLMPHALYGFMFLVAWQMQHFMTIAYQFQDQYEKAGYKMMQNKGALHKGIAWTAVLCAMPFGAVYFGVASQMLLVTGTTINGLLVWSYARWYRAMHSDTTDDAQRNKAARSTMLYGILYFFLMFSATIYHALDNKYHMFTTLIPDYIRQAAFALCPVAWRSTPNVVPVAPQVLETQGHHEHNPAVRACTHDHAQNDRACIYMRLVKQDTLDRLEPKAAVAATTAQK